MQYFVLAADGNQYGPADVPTLEQWATQSRISAATMLKDATNGQSVPASSVLSTFKGNTLVAAPVPPATQYAQPPYAAPTNGYATPPSYASQPESRPRRGGNGALWGVIIGSVLALVSFFVLHGVGLIIGGYTLFDAIKAQSNGHRHGPLMIGIAGVAMAAVGIGWFLRLG